VGSRPFYVLFLATYILSLPFPMTTSDCVAELLQRFGYPFENRKGTDFRFRLCTGLSQFWRTQILVHDEIVELYVFVTDNSYLFHHQSRVMEMVCRLNSSPSCLNSWQMDWDSGSVHLFAGLDLRGHSDRAGAIERHLNAVRFPLALWKRCFSLIGTEASASAIVNAALISEGCHPQRETDESRRVLLTLVKPSKAESPTEALHPSDIEGSLDILLNEIGRVP